MSNAYFNRYEHHAASDLLDGAERGRARPRGIMSISIKGSGEPSCSTHHVIIAIRDPHQHVHHMNGLGMPLHITPSTVVAETALGKPFAETDGLKVKRLLRHRRGKGTQGIANIIWVLAQYLTPGWQRDRDVMGLEDLLLSRDDDADGELTHHRGAVDHDMAFAGMMMLICRPRHRATPS